MPARDLSTAQVRERYITLLKRALTHTLYWPLDINWENDHHKTDEAFAQSIAEELKQQDFDWAAVRADGRDWPKFAQTMVGMKRLDNVQHCIERVLADGVPGDLIETGVWRGGVVIFMRALLDVYGDDAKLVYAADSFAGLPPPADDYPADAASLLHDAKALAIPRSEVERNLEMYCLLDDRVRFLEGWFKDTLPTVRDRTWSVIRLDGDMYESTMDGLVNLYPQLSVGGFLIVDDYSYEPCRQAVSDYRDANGITEPIEQIDWLGAFWRRAGDAP